MTILKRVQGPTVDSLVPLSSELEAAIEAEGRHIKFDFEDGPPTDDSA
jgi:hypothetical protein